MFWKELHDLVAPLTLLKGSPLIDPIQALYVHITQRCGPVDKNRDVPRSELTSALERLSLGRTVRPETHQAKIEEVVRELNLEILRLLNVMNGSEPKTRKTRKPKQCSTT